MEPGPSVYVDPPVIYAPAPVYESPVYPAPPIYRSALVYCSAPVYEVPEYYEVPSMQEQRPPRVNPLRPSSNFPDPAPLPMERSGEWSLPGQQIITPGGRALK